VLTRNLRVRRYIPAATVAAGLGALTLQPYAICPFAVFSGLPCPGCGMSRSLFALLQGNLALALHYHPLGPLLAAGAVLLLALRWFRRRWPSKITIFRWSEAPSYVWWGTLVLVMSVWIARFAGAFGGPAEVTSPLELLQTLKRK
jgi:hypothetical protein